LNRDLYLAMKSSGGVEGVMGVGGGMGVGEGGVWKSVLGRAKEGCGTGLVGEGDGVDAGMGYC
jgi:hypothetical protein